VWRNGFAGDTIGIDDLQTSAVPEPMTFGAFGAGLALFLRRRR
jgi:PEP-CTERM motif-containing protein